MPTNILRARNTRVSAKDAAATPRSKRGPRRIRVTIGQLWFEADLTDSLAADRIWAALPLNSVAEVWGAAVHFEVPVESGREAGATAAGKAGTLYFWSEEHRVLIPHGPTPISRVNEMRLPVPCTAWARTAFDVSALAPIRAGQKVSLQVAS
jgi:hypothetical protein